MNMTSQLFGFSWLRWWAMLKKEFFQLRRDRVTFGMIIGIPIIQLTLFGYAINTDPKHLPTAVISADQSEFTRSFVAALQVSDYFDVVMTMPDEAAARAAMAQGTVRFVVTIPPNFTRNVLRGERPEILVEADATDSVAAGPALATLNQIALRVAERDLKGGLVEVATVSSAFNVNVHRLYNPESITQYNIVPGLMGVILTMTLVMMTGLAITRERERGTMENLLSMPLTPFEVMTGKIVPYILIGLIQSTIILCAAYWVFNVPFQGSVAVLYLATLLFIACNLTVGITLSSLAQNQLQAMQLTIFYFLPSILLSGFMFPFQGMPHWAQMIGNMLPLTYYLKLVRGILLKGNGWADLWPDLWPLFAFMAVVMTIAVRFYRRTLD